MCSLLTKQTANAILIFTFLQFYLLLKLLPCPSYDLKVEDLRYASLKVLRLNVSWF